MIVVDSSVWVEILRDSAHPLAEFVRKAALSEVLASNGVILSELLQGARDKGEYERIRSSFAVIPLRDTTTSVWEETSRIAFSMNRKGFNIPLTDCLIAAHCLEYDDEILTLDKHFDFLTKNFPLKKARARNV